ncbi:MAG TPA: hypothetical protein VLD66_04110 [Methyloceanibacter sp.]|nr:hypothetical protein [Methyloceanibacter sp.]
MASPLREKRTWPPREKDADSAESAAFEATVAVVKETVVRSGEVLTSAKEDLSDHKRWLEAQRAAVQADRARHERWLQKQQEKQEALERRERAKRRRQLMRQNAMLAVENAAFAVLDSVLSLFWSCVGKIAAFFAYLRDSILAGFAWVGARFRDLGAYIARLAKSGASAISGKTRVLAGSAGSALSAASSSVAAKSGELARSTGSAFSAAGSSLKAKSAEIARSTGNVLLAAGSSVAAKSSEIAKATGLRPAAVVLPAEAEPAGTGADQASVFAGDQGSTTPAESFVTAVPEALAAPKPASADLAADLPSASIEQPAIAASEQPVPASSEEPASILSEQSASAELAEGSVPRPVGEAVAARLAPILAVIAATVRSSVETLARSIAATSAKAAPFAEASATRVKAAASAASAKVQTLSPHLHGALRKGVETSGFYAKEAAARAGALLARIKPTPSMSENEVSSPPSALSSLAGRRVGGYDLSQMLIISGVVLLVCGGLLVGGGLVLRAGGAGSVASLVEKEKPPSPHAVAWFFEEPELPIVERSVFSAELTPQGVRLTGLAIKAENNSDDALSGLEGVVKPDAKRLDLKLEVKVDMVPTEGAHAAEAAEVPANGVIPPHAFFRLVFPFPPEAHGEAPGIALNDFIAAYGGLMLKLRYDVAGTHKTLIHYLSPEMLKAQLTEIQHEADGS